jgi:hypothetical protein
MESKNIVRKLIDLPLKTASGLLILAAKKGIPTKHYIEQVIIAHEMKTSGRAENKKRNKF